ncbi:hypothetical protein UlMin_009979 [Ulmus minor]
MATTSLLSIALCSLLVFNVCFAQVEQLRRSQQQRPQSERWRTECRLQRLNALKPSRQVRSEAGNSEYWDVEQEDQLQCAGFSAARHTIQQRGLLLPSFLNTPDLFYVLQGSGIHGAVFPGCPQTYESSPSQSREGRRESQRSGDEHQKVRPIQQGDIVAVPAGVTQWVYNDGNSPLVLISFMDVGNQANQLDISTRRFHLAGNPRREQQSQQQQQGQEGSRGQQENNGNNIFSGFDEKLLAEAFNVDVELARKLQNEDDNRERIVRVRDEFQIMSPGRRQEEGQSERDYNGVEETFCTLRLHQNIDRPSEADIFNPRGGRITTVDRRQLPVLRALQLSAERGVLYKNALVAPHFNAKSHSVIYVTDGSGRLQVVDDNGNNVFDGELQEGQLLVVPQNFAVIKRAGDRGFKWIAVKSSDNPQRTPLAGRISVIRGLPNNVLENAFNLSEDEAQDLKYNREEVTIFSPNRD